MSYVKFKSALNGQYMTCPGGIKADSFIYAQGGSQALLFEKGGDDTSSNYRVVNTPEGVGNLYMSYRGSTGAMKLVGDATDAYWQITPQGNVHGIRNTTYNDYVWTTSDGYTYLTRHGDPTSTEAQWFVEPVA